MVRVGLAYARQGRTEAAILTLARAAERYPDEPEVYTALGRLWLENAAAQEDGIAVQKALEALEPAASRASATSETLTLYGRALFLAGRTEAAVRALQQATSRAPVEPVAYLYLSDAARAIGNAALAIEAEARYAALTSS
jgi:predicted Zn-dependent protease